MSATENKFYEFEQRRQTADHQFNLHTGLNLLTLI